MGFTNYYQVKSNKTEKAVDILEKILKHPNLFALAKRFKDSDLFNGIAEFEDISLEDGSSEFCKTARYPYDIVLRAMAHIDSKLPEEEKFLNYFYSDDEDSVDIKKEEFGGWFWNKDKSIVDEYRAILQELEDSIVKNRDITFNHYPNIEKLLLKDTMDKLAIDDTTLDLKSIALLELKKLQKKGEIDDKEYHRVADFEVPTKVRRTYHDATSSDVPSGKEKVKHLYSYLDDEYAKLLSEVKDGNYQRLTSYLQTLSNFTNLSVNNVFLLHSQAYERGISISELNTFNGWKNTKNEEGDNVRILKGSKGFDFVKAKRYPVYEKDEFGNFVLDDNGEKIIETDEDGEEKFFFTFYVEKRFDISQTNADSVLSKKEINSPEKILEELKNIIPNTTFSDKERLMQHLNLIQKTDDRSKEEFQKQKLASFFSRMALQINPSVSKEVETVFAKLWDIETYPDSQYNSLDYENLSEIDLKDRLKEISSVVKTISKEIGLEELLYKDIVIEEKLHVNETQIDVLDESHVAYNLRPFNYQELFLEDEHLRSVVKNANKDNAILTIKSTILSRLIEQKEFFELVGSDERLKSYYISLTSNSDGAMDILANAIYDDIQNNKEYSYARDEESLNGEFNDNNRRLSDRDESNATQRPDSEEELRGVPREESEKSTRDNHLSDGSSGNERVGSLRDSERGNAGAISTFNKEAMNLMDLITGMSINGTDIKDIDTSAKFEDLVNPDDATFEIYTKDGNITVDWSDGESGIYVEADVGVDESLVEELKAHLFSIEDVFNRLQTIETLEEEEKSVEDSLNTVKVEDNSQSRYIERILRLYSLVNEVREHYGKDWQEELQTMWDSGAYDSWLSTDKVADLQFLRNNFYNLDNLLEEEQITDEQYLSIAYPFMDSEDKEKNRELISKALASRSIKVSEELGFRNKGEVGIKDEMFEYWKQYHKENENNTELSYFGIDDVFKPIDEYINDIKTISQEYQSYIANKNESFLQEMEETVKEIQENDQFKPSEDEYEDIKSQRGLMIGESYQAGNKTYTFLGKNLEEEDVYEDENGIRFNLHDTHMYQEKIKITPSGNEPYTSFEKFKSAEINTLTTQEIRGFMQDATLVESLQTPIKATYEAYGVNTWVTNKDKIIILETFEQLKQMNDSDISYAYLMEETYDFLANDERYKENVPFTKEQVVEVINENIDITNRLELADVMELSTSDLKYYSEIILKENYRTSRDYENYLNDSLKQFKNLQKFGAGFMGGVDTVIWDRTVEENGDYKRVGTVDKGVARLNPDYQNDNEAIAFAKRMGATSFEHIEIEEDKSVEAHINFNSREEAEEFATQYSRRTLRGHIISNTSVTVYALSDEDRAWIDNYISNLNNSNASTIEDDKKYYYGLTYRPAGLGAVPSGYKIENDYVSPFRHGVISYDRRLTSEELDSFELTDLSDEQIEYVSNLAFEGMSKYAQRYLENEKAFDSRINDFGFGGKFSTRINPNRHQELKDTVRQMLSESIENNQEKFSKILTYDKDDIGEVEETFERANITNYEVTYDGGVGYYTFFDEVEYDRANKLFNGTPKESQEVMINGWIDRLEDRLTAIYGIDIVRDALDNSKLSMQQVGSDTIAVRNLQNGAIPIVENTYRVTDEITDELAKDVYESVINAGATVFSRDTVIQDEKMLRAYISHLGANAKHYDTLMGNTSSLYSTYIFMNNDDSLEYLTVNANGTQTWETLSRDEAIKTLQRTYKGQLVDEWGLKDYSIEFKAELEKGIVTAYNKNNNETVAIINLNSGVTTYMDINFDDAKEEAKIKEYSDFIMHRALVINYLKDYFQGVGTPTERGLLDFVKNDNSLAIIFDGKAIYQEEFSKIPRTKELIDVISENTDLKHNERYYIDFRFGRIPLHDDVSKVKQEVMLDYSNGYITAYIRDTALANLNNIHNIDFIPREEINLNNAYTFPAEEQLSFYKRMLADEMENMIVDERIAGRYRNIIRELEVEINGSELQDKVDRKKGEVTLEEWSELRSLLNAGNTTTLKELLNRATDKLDRKYEFELSANGKELTISNLKDFYTVSDIDKIFISKQVQWEVFSNKYIFDLTNEEHLQLLSEELAFDLSVNQVETVQDTASDESDNTTTISQKYQNDIKEDFIIEDDTIEGGAKTRFKNNLKAIEVLRKLEKDEELTKEDKIVLSKYVGWGGIPQAFYKPDGSVAKGWEKEAEELKETLTDLEYENARRSTLDSHYTPKEISENIWSAIEHFGFNGGKILEPSVGIGNFIGTMPKELKNNTKLYGVELDSLTSKIATNLYPNATITNMGFEEYALRDNSIDLVIGNPPFGSQRLSDEKRDFSIHNYFFAKSVDALKEGGIVAMVVSNSFLDSNNSSARDYISKKANLVGAIRLPNNAFSKNANTEVTTDIIFLQKRTSEQSSNYDEWNAIGELNETPINKYFVAHQDNLLGVWGKYGTMYRGDEGALIPQENQDTKALLQDAIKRLPSGIFGTQSDNLDEIKVEASDDISNSVRVGAFYRHLDSVYKRLPDENGEFRAEKLEFNNEKAKERVIGMIAVAEVGDKLRKMQLSNDYDDNSIEATREELNRVYDEFVGNYGYLTNSTNKRLFEEDNRSSFLLSLERKYDKGVSRTVAKNTGQKFRKESAEKADIFSSRTQFPYQRPTKADNIKSALSIALSEYGYVNIPYMSDLLDKNREQVLQDLINEDLIYEDVNNGWVTKEEYLSGNVKKKLAETTDPRNIKALLEVIPEDIAPVDISVKAGAGWIPRKYIEQFVKDITGDNSPKAIYTEFNATWNVSAHSLEVNNNDFGTKRVRADRVVDAVLNNKQITVYDKQEDGTQIVNHEETMAVANKIELVKQRWEDWIWEDEERREVLAKIYNERFNVYAKRQYDGSHLQLQGKVSDEVIELRPHQKNAVWRTLQSNNILFDHTVGTGKAQPLDAKILTPSGWTTMGNIKVGDYVISVDGTKTKVLGVYPQGIKDIYKVTFSDGSSTECCDEHLWLTQTYEERNYESKMKQFANKDWDCAKPKIRTLHEIRHSLVSSHLNAKNHSIPLVKPIEFDAKELKIDAYMLGLLLGDGGFRGKGLIFSTKDSELISAIEKILDDEYVIKHISKYDYAIRIKDRSITKSHKYIQALREYGLFGKLSDEKFIPQEMLFSTVENRIAILQGLMDTDGTVDSRKGTNVSFSTSSLQLSKDVKSLVQSLGGIVKTTIKKPFYYTSEKVKKFGKKSYILSLSLPNSIKPFRLNRKEMLVVEKSRYTPKRYIVDVSLVGKKEAQCISVEHKDHLYITDDYIVTHNTYTAIASVMELKRTGRAKKPLVVVPNHLPSEWGKQFMELYPNANILVATKKDFEKNKRKVLMSRIATGNYDAVVIGHSQLIKIENDKEFTSQILKEQISEVQEGIDLLRIEDSGNSRSVKDAERSRDAMKERLKKLLEGKRDDSLNFTELGIDCLVVDEAHEFKNLEYSTRLRGVAGLGNPTGSKKAFDLFVKIREMHDRTNGKNLIFLTGTPISNTIAEMYTMQKYAQYDELKSMGLLHFDAWARQNAEVTTDWELSPSGKYKLTTRLAKFVNLPELMKQYTSFADVITREDVNRQLKEQGKRLPVPNMKGGKPQNVVVDRSEEQAEYIGVPDINGRYPEHSLVFRSENLPKDQSEDNMLKIMSEARKVALDMRIIDSSYPDNPNSKVNVAVKNALELYHRWNKDKGTQLVFCDLSTPKKSKAKEKERIEDLIRRADEGDDSAVAELEKLSPSEIEALSSDFSVYDDMKEKLIKAGIPEHEIAFIHDANTDLQKEELYASVNSGKIRFLFGSTSKMGAGMNVQERLVGLHHLDVPWRPSDLEQREGRIIRQGNKLYENDPDNFEVEVFRYATKNTLDSRMWQTIEVKAKFIEQIKTAELTEREIEDIGNSEAMNSAEMKASSSGNPLILEEMDLKQKIKKLEAIKKNHNRTRYDVQDKIKSIKNSMEKEESEVAKYESDIDLAKDTVLGKDFLIEIEGVKFDKREDAGNKLLEVAKEMVSNNESNKEIGKIGGFTLSIERKAWSQDGAYLIIEGQQEYFINFDVREQKAGGLTLKITNQINRIVEEYEAYKEELEYKKGILPKLVKQDVEFPKENELQDLKNRYNEVIQLLQQKDDKKEQTSSSNEEDTRVSTIVNDWVDTNKDISTKELLASKRFDYSVLDRLGNYEIVGKCLVLNDTLDRKDYLVFQKAFETFGGIWDRKKQAIVFSEDGLDRMTSLLNSERENDSKATLSDIVSASNNIVIATMPTQKTAQSKPDRFVELSEQLAEIGTSYKGNKTTVEAFVRNIVEEGFTQLKSFGEGALIINPDTQKKFTLRNKEYAEYAKLLIDSKAKVEELSKVESKAQSTEVNKNTKRGRLR